MPSTLPRPPVVDCAHAECGCGMREFSERLQSLWNVVGDTPLLQVRCRFDGSERCASAKDEAGNLAGSIKDRMALHILEAACARGEIESGAVIVEASSGNTGISPRPSAGPRATRSGSTCRTSHCRCPSARTGQLATVFCDDDKKSLSTDLCREEPVLGHYLTPRVELTGVRVVPRTNACRALVQPCHRSGAPRG